MELVMRDAEGRLVQAEKKYGQRLHAWEKLSISEEVKSGPEYQEHSEQEGDGVK